MQLRKDLALRGLVIPSVWFSGTLITEPYEVVAEKFGKFLDFLAILGVTIVNYSEQSYSVQGAHDKSPSTTVTP